MNKQDVLLASILGFGGAAAMSGCAAEGKIDSVIVKDKVTPEEPQAVSLNARISQVFEEVMGDKPTKGTPPVPMEAHESLGVLENQYKDPVLDTNVAEKVGLAAQLTRLARDIENARPDIKDFKYTEFMAGIVGQHAEDIFGKLDNIEGYTATTAMGVARAQVVEYFAQRATEWNGAVTLLRHKNKDDKRLLVRWTIGNKKLDQIIEFDDKEKVKAVETRTEQMPEKETEDFVYQILKTTERKVVVLYENQTVLPQQNTLATETINELLDRAEVKKNDAKVRVPEGTTSTVGYATLGDSKKVDDEKKRVQKAVLVIDTNVYVLPDGTDGKAMDVQLQTGYIARWVKARHERNYTELEELTKITDFRGKPVSTMNDAYIAQKESARLRNDFGKFRDLVKDGRMTKDEAYAAVRTYLKSDEGKQIAIGLGLMASKKGTVDRITFGLQNDDYDAYVNLGAAVNASLVSADDAWALLERVGNKRRFSNSNEQIHAFALPIEFGKVVKMYENRLVTNAKGETLDAPWKAGIRGGLNPVTIDMLENPWGYGQAVKLPEKK